MSDEEVRAALLMLLSLIHFAVALRTRGSWSLGIAFGLFMMALVALAGGGFCLTIMIGAVITIVIAWTMQ